MLEQRRHRTGAARQETDGSRSWLHRRMLLSEPTVELVHSFLRSDLLLEFETMPGDVLLTFSFGEYSSSLEAHRKGGGIEPEQFCKEHGVFGMQSLAQPLCQK